MMSLFKYLLAFSIGFTALTAQPSTDYEAVSRSMESFGAVFREITTDYIDATDAEKIVRAGIDGMLKELDPYTNYLVGNETESIDRLSSGYYVGFGFTIGRRNNKLYMMDVRTGYPASNAGIRTGDQLISVDGVNVTHLPPDSLRNYTRGSLGTSAILTLAREGRDDTIAYYVTRDKIQVENIDIVDMLDGGIGYVRLGRFSRTTGSDLREALTTLQNKQPLNGLILDLRDNPGGLLEAAVHVAEIFLPAGATIVSTRNRLGYTHNYTSSVTPMLPALPLAILINERSASASEIVAGACQDFDRAVIIGKNSFGKGLVQTVSAMPHGATLKITTARYYTPSGRCIQKDIRPDLTQTTTGGFTTKNGRAVIPSSGIAPDTIVSESALPTPASSVDSSGLIADFATQYAARFAFLPPDFVVTDSIVSSFIEYVDRAPASRKASPLPELANIVESTEFSELKAPSQIAIKTAYSEVNKELRSALMRQQPLLKTLIDAEIRARFAGDTERIRRLLGYDPTIAAAKACLEPTRYRAELGGNSVDDQ